MTVILYGAGTEGAAAAAYFTARGVMPYLCDDSGKSLPGTQVISRDQAMQLVPGSLFLRSPGVPPTHPVVAEAAASARLATTPTGYWLLEHKPPATFTVTGTKGKSTTTALLAAILEAGGVTTALLGNIGAPALDEPLPKGEAAALEVSSYMMHDLPEADHIHVVTNLYKEHTDWHGSEIAYREAKLKPFRYERPATGFAPRALIDDEGLPPSVSAIEDIAGLNDGRLVIGKRTIDLAALSPVWRGPSALALRAAAAAAGCLFEAGRLASAIEEIAAGWKGLPSRQEHVPSDDGRLWIDDALATIPEATLKALEGFAGTPVSLILGGADRGQVFEGFVARAGQMPNARIIAFGPIGDRLPFERAESLEEAITHAAATCPEGGVILFSPAAPSSPPHGNYKERSAVFRAAAAAARPTGTVSER